MTSYCKKCFQNNTEEVAIALDRALKNSNVFWLGYVICDPKVEGPRTSKYDISMNEVKQIKFEGLKVVFNHNKHRKPLGHVVFSWHDHHYPNSDTFAVAFLAVLDNESLLRTPAIVTILGDSFVSLSTLKDDPRIPVEISITYCGARNGCFGMFVAKKRVKEMCQRLGIGELLSYKRSYKQGDALIDASYKERMEGEKEKSGGLEEVLSQLKSEQFDIIKEALSKDEEAIQSMCSKLEEERKQSNNFKEALTLISDYLSSMIQSRLTLEQTSDSELARKRRSDFQAMKDKGVFSKDCSDMDAIKEMIGYCRECFDDAPQSEKQLAVKVINMFQEKFPQLGNKLDHTDTALQTVDAAFNLINDHLQKQKVNDLVGAQRQALAKAQAMSIAHDQWKNLEPHNINRDTNQENKKQKQNTMDFETFAKRAGIFNDPDIDEPARKKRKCNDQVPHADNEEFMQYVAAKEKKQREEQERLSKYYKEFEREKKEHEQKKFKMIQTVYDSLPHLMKVIDQMGKSTTQNKSSSEAALSTAEKTNQQDTVDASMLVEEKSILFDL